MVPCREQCSPEAEVAGCGGSGPSRAGRGRARLSPLEGGRRRVEEDAAVGTRRIALPLQPSSCAMARHFVRAALVGEEWLGDVEAAVLLSSELVANAMCHARSPCQLSLRIEGSRLRIEAADAGPEPAVLAPPGPDSPHGRGLVLLDALASAWGTRVEPEEGKTIWFELSVRAGRRSGSREPVGASRQR